MYKFVTVMLFMAVPAFSQDAMDEFSRAAAVYELKMENIESYGKAMVELTQWRKENKTKAKNLETWAARQPKTLAGNLSVFDKEPGIVSIITRNKLTGMDMLFIPMVVMQAKIDLLGKAQGREFPADRINPANIVLLEKEGPKIDAIMEQVRVITSAP